MTPREKAVELVHKFGMENQYYERAKQCALIAVEEIINVAQPQCHIQSAHNLEETLEYWEQVKQEIQKL
jgi:hypothetical protein